jgi:hypothetical protein
VAVGEIVFGELPEIIAVRAEVVINDVEYHAETCRMRARNKAAQVIGRAI